MTNTNSDTDPADGDDDGEGFTDETQVRVKWLGSMMAVLTILGFFGLVYATAFGYARFDRITGAVFTVLALLVLAAGTWTFGIDLINKYTGK